MRLDRLIRRRKTARDASAREWSAKPLHPLAPILTMALEGTYPFDTPSMKREWIDQALELARRRARSPIDVKVPWWNRLAGTPPNDDLFIAMDELPSGAGPVRLWGIGGTSDSYPVLIANLALVLRCVGADADELVKSMESRSPLSKSPYMLGIACIPGSVKA